MGVYEMATTRLIDRRIFIPSVLGVMMFTHYQRVSNTDLLEVDLEGGVRDGEIEVVDAVASQFGGEAVGDEVFTGRHMLEVMAPPPECVVGA